MKDNKVPVQSLIDHIKTAHGIDPWAMDMAAKLLEREKPVLAEIEGGGKTWYFVCGECHGFIDTSDKFCRHCGYVIDWGKK